MKKTFYEKKGRRYVPVSEYDNEYLDSFPSGAHLVVVRPGVTSRRFRIDPNYAALIAAGQVAEDAISNHIMQVSSLRVPEREQPLTEEQRAAWDAFAKAMGKKVYALEWCSYREAAEAGVKAMQAEAEKLMEHESVRKAYEHFQLMCQLVKKNGNV